MRFPNIVTFRDVVSSKYFRSHGYDSMVFVYHLAICTDTILISLFSVGLVETWLIVLVGVAYLIGVQGITAAIHIPLNNKIQKIKIEDLNDKALAVERINFEKKWNYFNNIRTVIAISVSLLFLVQLSLR